MVDIFVVVIGLMLMDVKLEIKFWLRVKISYKRLMDNVIFFDVKLCNLNFSVEYGNE